MEQWLSALLGGGLVTGGAVTLVLTGRLLPVWVVRKQMQDVETAHAAAVVLAKEAASTAAAAMQAAHIQSVDNLNASHEREITALRASQAEALASRDREQERLVAERDYERQARDVERNRADANAQQLSESTREFGETIVHLLRSLPDVPESGRSDG